MFGDFFKRKKKPEQSNDDWKSKLLWLPVGHTDNPFPEEVLDCRSVALTLWSATKYKSVADSFNRLRSSDGKELRGKLPENPMVTDCNLRFPYDGQHHEGPMYVAKQMEDKWDFYAYDGRLYVRRSWTGHLSYVAELEYSRDVVNVKRIHSDCKEPGFAIAALHFLITTHLGRTLIPFPILPAFPKTAAEQIALMAFSNWGRRAQFGHYIKLQPSS